MTIRSTLARLCRPDTHDEARQFTDQELKAALTQAVAELKRRGWRVMMFYSDDPIIRREENL